MHDLPSFATVSPVGLHVLDVEGLLRSPYAAPLSLDSERSKWNSQSARDDLSELFTSDPLGRTLVDLLVYNRSRDNDRVCPACRRWYRVGEPTGYDSEIDVPTTYTSFGDFIARPTPSPNLETNEVAREQDLSGICSRACMAVMNSGDESQFGLNADNVTAEQVNRHNAAIERTTGWSVRKTTPEEEASMGGVKLLYEKKR